MQGSQVSTPRDYYEILGASKNASPDELKKAFRSMAKKHHPDANPGDKHAEEKFKELNEAYEVLSDPQKKAAYDQFGHAGVAQGGPGGPGGQAQWGGGGAAGVDFGDIFGDVFDDFFGGRGGGRGGASRARAGSDLRYDLTLSFEQAAFGTTQDVKIRKMSACSTCNGSGAKPGSGHTTCSQCRGTGQVRVSQGFFSIARTCNRCGGEGEIPGKPCADCGGKGRLEKERTVTVKVPAGVDEGSRLRIRNEGEAGVKGGPSGDLYIFLHVGKHSFFERDGDDLHCEVPITFVQAALGCDVEVPTMTGTVKMKIPAGTQSGKVFRLREKGLKNPGHDGVGDQLVMVTVETPVNLNGKQKKVLEEFQSLSEDKNQPLLTGFWRKVQDLFAKRS
jgi:molecular chaperone DnaJ